MPVTVVVGAQWGDEGKGKITDILAEQAEAVIRYQGGSNAGHTVVVNGEEFKFHLVPSGILHDNCICIMGDGTVVDPVCLADEIRGLKARGVSCDRLFVSGAAHIIMPYHRLLDKLQEEARGKGGIGTTLRGIGPAYTDKTARMPLGVRAMDLLDEADLRARIEAQLADKNRIFAALYDHPPMTMDEVLAEVMPAMQVIAPHVMDTREMVFELLARDANVVMEGAQATFLDLDYGTYPFVTSSHPVAGGACLGTGVGPKAISEVWLVCKAYTTRVGAGVFPTEDLGAPGDDLRERGREYGTTTGRPRRCGWLDGVILRTAVLLNGATHLAVTKLDVLDSLAEIPVCVGYKTAARDYKTVPQDARILEDAEPVYEMLEGWQTPITEAQSFGDLPTQAQKYLDKMQELAGIPVRLASVGQQRAQTVM
jgi:adenylosuccinate synthase